MRSSYSEDQVRALIENYQQVVAKRDTTEHGLFALVRLADLDLALRQVRWDYRRVLLLRGMLGLTAEATAELLQVSRQAVDKRYRYALEELHYLMNGGV